MSRHEYSLEIEVALSQLGWYGRLNEAMTADDVVTIARDYTAQWSPAELAELPPELRPGKIVDQDDVAGYALALVQAQMASAAPAESPLHKMGAFFSSASLRVAQIMARVSEVSSEPAESASRYTR